MKYLFSYSDQDQSTSEDCCETQECQTIDETCNDEDTCCSDEPPSC